MGSVERSLRGRIATARGGRFRRSPATPNRPCKSKVVQFFVSRGASQKQSAPAHVATPDKVRGKEQSFAQNRQQAIDVFSRRNASQQNDFASRRRERFGGLAQGTCKPRLIGINFNIDKLTHLRLTNAGVGRKQTAAGRDDLHTRKSLGGIGKLPPVSQLSPKI